MHYFIFPEKDSFISSNPSIRSLNNGFDEVLEIEKSNVSKITNNFTYLSSSISGSVTSSILTSSFSTTQSVYLSRALLQFDIDSFSSSISSGELVNPKFTLNLKTLEASQLPSRYTIVAHPISGSWEEGTGRKFAEVESDGVTWDARSSDSTELWSSAGGDFYQNISDSQSFSYQTSDIKMDVTNIVMQWISGSIENNGIILSQLDETSDMVIGSIKFFSKDTNTIYYPYLDVSWDDSTYVTGSSSVVLKNIYDQKVIYINNISPEYSQGSIIRFNVSARDKYVRRTFQKWPNQNVPFNDYLFTYTLPTSSYFNIRDLNTNETVIDFDDSTKISADISGSYFHINTSGLPQERFYKFSIKVKENDNVNIYDIQTPFKIRR